MKKCFGRNDSRRRVDVAAEMEEDVHGFKKKTKGTRMSSQAQHAKLGKIRYSKVGRRVIRNTPSDLVK